MSLVELLVALAIGVVLAFGAMNLLLHSKQSYLQSEELARLQENGRYAQRLLTRELAMAGYLGSELPGAVVDPTPGGSPCFNHLLRTGAPLEHFNDVTAAGIGTRASRLPDDCLVAGAHQVGSDLLLTRRTADRATTRGGIIVVAPANDALYLRAQGNTAATRIQRGGGAGAGDSLWEYLPQILFLRTYSRERGDGIPALCRKRPGRSSNGMAPTECLIEGIENLQIEFALDDDGDQRADRFESEPAELDLRRALAVHLYLLVRSVHPLAGHVDDKSYTLGATRVPAARDAYYRRVFHTTVVLRNTGAFRL